MVRALLDAYYPADPDVALVAVNLEIRDGQIDAADRIFQAVLSGVVPKSDPMLLAEAELLSARGDIDAALQIIEPLATKDAAPLGAHYALIRLLAEKRAWDRTFEAAVGLLERDVSYRAVLEPLVLAARKTGRLDELHHLLARPELDHQSGLDFVRQAVLEDLVTAGTLSVDTALSEPNLLPARRARLTDLAVTQAVPRDRRLEIYYCADKGYLEPALISMLSLVASNMLLARTARVTLLVDPDIIAEAERGLAPIRQTFGIDVSLVDATNVVPPTAVLRAEYGMLTGGQSLSVAAYYRIFYALHLAQRGDVDQALYIDADTIVGPALAGLFAGDAIGPAVMARSEVTRPEIDRAARSHKLTRAYFNSGVLRFDFRHPETRAALERSVAAALDPEVQLFFQDQCALNIGFRDQVTPLDSRFNHFVTPEKVYDDRDTGAPPVILHYLDRPKPWDSLYRRPAGRWFTWCRTYRDLVAGMAEAGE